MKTPLRDVKIGSVRSNDFKTGLSLVLYRHCFVKIDIAFNTHIKERNFCNSEIILKKLLFFRQYYGHELSNLNFPSERYL